MRSTSPDREFPFAQGIEEAQLFTNRTGGEVLTMRAFAFKDVLEVEGHGVSARN